MGWIIGIVVLLLILLLSFEFGVRAPWRGVSRFTLERTREVRSGLDGLPYRVHLVHENPARAADVLAELNRRAVELLRHLRRTYSRGAAQYPARRVATQRLLGLYNPDNLAENSPRDPEGDTSYTIDKGAVLALCLREADAHGLHDIETLMFVTLHELTHIAVEDVDHPPRFWQAFKFILGEARQAGVLRGVDYGRYPTNYCGLDIDYNPLYDQDLAPII